MEHTPFRLSYHLLLTTGTKFGLPEKELSKESDDYILKGRYIGSDRGGMQPDLFLKGNPVDILTKFISEHNFASENSVGTETYNLYGSKILFPATDVTLESEKRGEDFFNGMWHHRYFLKEGLEFVYDKGILKPEPFVVDPKELEVVQRMMKRGCPIEYSENDSGYVPKPQVIEPTSVSENPTFSQYKNKNNLLRILSEANNICRKGISKDEEIHGLSIYALERVRDKSMTPEQVVNHLF